MNDQELIAALEAKGAPKEIIDGLRQESWQEDVPTLPPEPTVDEDIALIKALEDKGAPKEIIDGLRNEALGSERARLEAQLEEDVAGQQQAATMLEGAQDTAAENLLESAGQIAAGWNEGVLEIADLVTSPFRYVYRGATGNSISIFDAFGKNSPRDAQFVEEPVVRDGLRALGNFLAVGGGLQPVVRSEGAVSSALLDIMGIGTTESTGVRTLDATTRRALDLRTGVTEGVDITSEASLINEIDNIAKRIEVGANKAQFEAFEETAALTGKWEEKVLKVQKKWDDAVVQLKNATEDQVEKAEQKVAAILDELTVLKGEDPRLVGPQLSRGGLERYNAKRSAVLNELSDRGVSRSYVDELIRTNGLFKPKGFQELIDFDVTSKAKMYDGTGTGYSKAAAVFRPASALMKSKVGSIASYKFERAFESAARMQELLTIKYSRDEKALRELSEWAELADNKRRFLDLRFNPDLLKELNESAAVSLSPAAKDMFNELLKDSRKHQAAMKSVYKDEVTTDEIFWASQKKQEEMLEGADDQYIPGAANARSTIEQVRTSDTVTGSLNRSRGKAFDMDDAELASYANPVLEQIKRLNQEQAYKYMAKNFEMRQSIGLGDDSKQFFQVFEDTVGRQSGSKAKARIAREIAEGTYVGSTKRPSILVEGFMKQSYAGTLGQLDSALLNLHDVFISMLQNGVKPTLKAMLKREGMDIRDLGIGGDVKSLGEFQQAFENTLEDGKILKGLEWSQRKFFKWSGFRLMDRAGKGVVMRAALNKARAAAKGGRLEREFGYMMEPKELAKINKYLKEGTAVEDIPDGAREIVEELMFARLGEQQLISAAGRPLYYMQNPSMRWAYALSGFAIKQMEMMKVGVYDALRKGEYQKAGNFMAGYMIFGAGGFALINNVRGLGQWYLGDERREPTAERFIASLIEQPVSVATMGRLGNPYANQQFSTDPVGYLGKSVIPPSGFIGNAAKDASRAVRGKDPQYYVLNSIPYGDEMRAWLVK